MTKYRYLQVQAEFRGSHSACIRLPSNWDAMLDDERAVCVKMVAGEAMMEVAVEIESGLARWLSRNTYMHLEEWEIFSETRDCVIPLAEIVTKPLIQLVLEGVYEYKNELEWDDDHDDCPPYAWMAT